MTNQTLSAERARELFSYDPLTGVLTWAVSRGRVRAGAPAGYRGDDGYVRVGVEKSIYLAHRLIWLIVTGEWPRELIDHANGVPYDNRYDNLRDEPPGFNQQNKHWARSDSCTGLLGTGVRGAKFRSRIHSGGAEVSLGYFKTPEEAHQAYLSAKRALHAGCTI